MDLKGQVGIITGAARGIGKEIAFALARRGVNCVLCDMDTKQVNETAEEIANLGVETLPITLNVADLSQVEQMKNKVIDKFQRIDILINNAGITKDGLLLRMKEADWDAVISVNLKGTFNCTKAVIKAMVQKRYGRIVNIASIIGLIGNVGQANYSASKAGIIGLTKSTARETALRNINVNAIAPGFIETKMTKVLSDDVKSALLKQIPLGRFGKPEDVADLVIFLVSDKSSYITGQVVQINGGMLM
ncbi:MAG: beta-ketoacyl-ACP reductase [Candidatus Omnitrophota bacterium]|nr:MAG: beta-ketoacyl-ACP reductase [Candidatus Omnitrophota bacterium]